MFCMAEPKQPPTEGSRRAEYGGNKKAPNRREPPRSARRKPKKIKKADEPVGIFVPYRTQEPLRANGIQEVLHPASGQGCPGAPINRNHFNERKILK